MMPMSLVIEEDDGYRPQDTRCARGPGHARGRAGAPSRGSAKHCVALRIRRARAVDGDAGGDRAIMESVREVSAGMEDVQSTLLEAERLRETARLRVEEALASVAEYQVSHREQVAEA